MPARPATSSESPSIARRAEAAAIRNRDPEAQLTEVRSATSRRDLLGAFAVVPVAVWAKGRSVGFEASIAAPSDIVPLRRTNDGRQLSRVRYHRAESFF